MSVAEVTFENVHWDAGADAVIADCSFSLERGKLTAMLGPSGCGKSSIAFLLAGYERGRQGRVLIDGKPVTKPSRDTLVVFQESALMPWLNTLDNVMFGPLARGERSRHVKERANELLERVGLANFAKHYPGELSGGMQRRAELARALINDPGMLILDEPFRGLDALTREFMQEYCARLFGERPRTTLFITTDIDEALFLADRLLLMTNRPARVAKAIDVDLPRPRDRAALREDEHAQEIKTEALELLHAEARASFALT
ncbi:MAG TPA: ABC transporter ATP-binding protein [Thermoleophilaceae bacterium]|jgi:NitT/TauT family transport system ATP-binding protein